jgi:hypothetical protein
MSRGRCFLAREGMSRFSHSWSDCQRFERLHFPTGRVPIEAIIRFLIDDFGVEANEEKYGGRSSRRPNGCSSSSRASR